MIGLLKRAAKYLATTLTLAALSNCQVMDSAVTYELRPDGSQVQACKSALGSYALPYSTITVTVTQNYQGGVKTGRPTIQVSDPDAHPDPKHIYCLDMLENPFSDDDVTVAFYKKGDVDKIDATQQPTAIGLLSLIASKSTDQTGEIIRNLLRAVFMLASGDQGFSFNRESGSEPITLTQQTVDPFDLAAMAALNRSLHEYGYCVTFGKFTYDTNRTTIDSYCNKPESFVSSPPFLSAAKDQHYLVNKLPVGVYYRPREPYQMFIYQRDDPDSGKPWQLGMVNTLMLENLSPILALEVNRTLFAQYRTALAFDRGNLYDVCIAKGSEVLGGIEIPLDLIYGLVSLPASTLKAEITQKTSTTALLAAQSQVIEVQNQILAAKADSYPGADANATGKVLGNTNIGFGTTAPLSSTVGRVNETPLANFCQLLKEGA